MVGLDSIFLCDLIEIVGLVVDDKFEVEEIWQIMPYSEKNYLIAQMHRIWSPISKMYFEDEFGSELPQIYLK